MKENYDFSGGVRGKYVYREGLPEMPSRIKKLLIDPKRGYPVPKFVEWLIGTGNDAKTVEPGTPGSYPEFRAMRRDFLIDCVEHSLCWVCGDPLGKWVTFVAGPMCGVNRISAEPPSHHDCATFSAKACPFLTMPKMVRREDDLIDNKKLVDMSAGMAIARNPGVAMLWTTDRYVVIQDKGGLLFRMADPLKVEWYAEGRLASREEVIKSVNSGLPTLEEACEGDKEQLELLANMVVEFMPNVPA
jgi:hypothetical protein